MLRPANKLRPALTAARMRMAFVLAAAVSVLAPAQALAVNPENAVGGNGSKWFSGTFLFQSGLNCSILGGSYSETMVSAIAGYGGAPNQGVVRVGDRYYASLLVSIPGNPCGSGSSIVGTDLVLPRGTAVDTSAPIRCFGQPRNANDFGELTGGTWGPFFGSTGSWCPAQVGSSLTGTPGAVGVGFRPLANGVLYQLFVPIKSTLTLQGAAASPVDQIRWVLSTSGTYNNQGSTSVWTNVFPAGAAGAGNSPFIYFARDPSVEPFWDSNAPAGTENRAEWFANLYSAGIPGTFCWELYVGSTPTGSVDQSCNTVPGWSGTVTNASDLWQVFGNGPNGGYVPLFYGPSETYTILWKFTYNTGSGNQAVTRPHTFTTLAGPDTDGDGVPDSQDACPDVKGTEPNGCQPPVQTDPDGDGVFGSADKCPDQHGGASPDGCPVAGQSGTDGGQNNGPSTDAPDLTAPGLTVRAPKGKLRSVLSKGLTVNFNCSEACTYSAEIQLARKFAKNLGIAAKPVVIGRGSKQLSAAGSGKVKVRFTSKARKRLKRVRRLKVTLVSRASDSAGNTSPPVRRKLTLKR